MTTRDEQRAREWFDRTCANASNITFRDYFVVELLAAYGSSEYERGVREGLERAAKQLETFAGNWVDSLPIDQRESLNCKQYAKAIRQIK